ncbi:MAG: bifunctional folylpolyglutamate synthase/dihydrofolate synthase [Robiginitomaculum sp.]|nr:MAG: bifunctional folylpolyglutamate synthase/dihydrofolate synthase [Robiginitomaculum sp.]
MDKDSAKLKDALKHLEHLHPKKIDLGLERIERVLKALGNPQDSLPPTVHIAGTNGKGSTLAFLRAIAEAQGLRVHVYTSPHLVSFRERIVLAGAMIEEPVLLDALARVQTANDGKPLSFFEATTAAAFLAFSEHPADLLLLETGLGGRYDATNVISQPAAIAITAIDYDHKEFLGNDLAGIAREKAGIFKPHTPAFSAPQTNLVRAVLSSEAATARTDLKNLDEHFHCYRQQGRLVYEDEGQLLDLPLPALTGDHQTINAGLAIAIAKTLHIDDRAIAKGIANARWPARLHPLTHGPLFEITNAHQAELWLDGGHNPHAARAIAAALAEIENKSPRPLVLVMGMLANKDAPGFLDAFTGLAHALIAVPIRDHAAIGPDSLIDMAKGRGLEAYAADTLTQAVIKACTLKTEMPPRILICGSLYLAGEALALG